MEWRRCGGQEADLDSQRFLDLLQECTLYLRLVGIALRRPWILPHLLGAAWAMRARAWYARAPFLPLPPRSYIEWRMDTAYGDAPESLTGGEMERYLEWSARMRRLMRRAPHD